MRAVWAACAAVLLGVGALACGSASRDRPAPQAAARRSVSPSVVGAAASGSVIDADGDSDSTGGGRYDSDDRPVLGFGSVPSPSERQAIVAVVHAYYLAGAAGNAAGLCPLLYSITAEAIAEEQGEVPGAGGLSSQACARALSKLLASYRSDFVRDAAALRVTAVRAQGPKSVVLLNFGRFERRVLLHKEDGRWKMNVFSDKGLP